MAGTEGVIDSDLLEGVAASAIDTRLPEVAERLTTLFNGFNAAQITDAIEECRLNRIDGLSVSPAPRVRVSAVRARMADAGLDGFLVPLADEHQGEFIARRSQRLAWLTGFGGSAGLAIVLRDEAAIFVDGRYTLQVRTQVDTETFVPLHLTKTPPESWIRDHLSEGDNLGFDPWLHTSAGAKGLRDACVSCGVELVAIQNNPVDEAWSDQPPSPLSPIHLQDEEFAGIDSQTKCRNISSLINETKACAAVLTTPDSIAWLLNIRGSDVPNTPLALSFAIVHATGQVDWFLDQRKLSIAVENALHDGIRVHDIAAFEDSLARLGSEQYTVRVDPATVPEAVRLILQEAGATISTGQDPCVLPKARKNDIEIEGTKAAHVRDGAALSSFLAWLSVTAPGGSETEMSVAQKLYEFRNKVDRFQGLSFDTISGSGPNGAIVHYRVTPDTNRTLSPGDVYLVDSGAQYLDGTTDVTRTVYIGDGAGTPAPKEIRDRFTRVLKGHIAVATAQFPKGTHGSQIDALARLPLWEAGLDYDHGTGHGVGSFLGVHEGPQRISKFGGGVPMEPGMILSNEPGYYKEGAYGIRTENLVVVSDLKGSEGSERDMFGFETITLAPIDWALIDPHLLSDSDREWLNTYHLRVRNSLSPLVDADVRKWLDDATKPI